MECPGVQTGVQTHTVLFFSSQSCLQALSDTQHLLLHPGDGAFGLPWALAFLGLCPLPARVQTPILSAPGSCGPHLGSPALQHPCPPPCPQPGLLSIQENHGLSGQAGVTPHSRRDAPASPGASGFPGSASFFPENKATLRQALPSRLCPAACPQPPACSALPFPSADSFPPSLSHQCSLPAGTAALLPFSDGFLEEVSL